MQVLVTLDGTVHDPNLPFLRADDLAAVRGDGIFETLLVRDGRACVVEWHLLRLQESAAALELPKPDLNQWRAAVAIAVQQWVGLHGTEVEGILRLALSRGTESFTVSEEDHTTAYITVGAVASRVEQVRREGISAITMERGFSIDLAARAPWQLLGAKTLSYATNMAALRHAASMGAEEVIFTSSEGYVLEGPRSTVVIMRDGKLITTPTNSGILAGTTVQALFDVASSQGYECNYELFLPADLFASQGVWMVSSVTLAARVHTLNGAELALPEQAAEFSSLVDLAVSSIGG
ncbi:MAG: aminodeoxychorismate lyase [Mycobacteriaceae bacterium]